MDFELSNYLLCLTAFLLVIVSARLIIVNNMLEAVIAMSLFSLLISVVYLIMDGPDVAMTEVALGSCLSTCVYLSFLQKLPLKIQNQITRAKIIPASIICLVFITTLIYVGLALHQYGDVNAPLQTHASKYYVENTEQDIGIPSFVAGLLASYRGYDTLGETTVILIAGISVLLLFSRKNEHA
jgi:multicomponent Na+:H+ antiporter subunit B